MQRRTLGRSGLAVTALGYGGWAIGGLGYGDQDERDADAAVDAYLRGGGRCIDTARGYGVSEILIGKRLKACAAAGEVFVASKSGSTHPPIVRTDLETSRFCLQRDALDLYYIHVPPPEWEPMDRLLDAYQELKARGRTRLVGVSCPNVDGEAEADRVRRYVADPRTDVIQIAYSCARPPVVGELIADAHRRGVGVVARMNLEGGFLTGKWKPGVRFTDKANDWRAGLAEATVDRIVALGQGLAARFVRPPYQTLAQLALAYCLANPHVSAVIPGGRSARQVEANLSVDRLPPLDAQTCKALAAAAAPMGPLLRERRKK
jgi:aryl-alcohol dehydrogenase-like predicted oxidoreductase